MLSANMNCKEYIILSISGLKLLKKELYKETCAASAIKITINDDLKNTSNIGHEVVGKRSPYTDVLTVEGMGPWTKFSSILRFRITVYHGLATIENGLSWTNRATANIET
jgi:hypothetical protein